MGYVILRTAFKKECMPTNDKYSRPGYFYSYYIQLDCSLAFHVQFIEVQIENRW